MAGPGHRQGKPRDQVAPYWDHGRPSSGWQRNHQYLYQLISAVSAQAGRQRSVMVLLSIGRPGSVRLEAKTCSATSSNSPEPSATLNSATPDKRGFPSPQFKTRRANLLFPVQPAPLLPSTPLPMHLRKTFGHPSSIRQHPPRGLTQFRV